MSRSIIPRLSSKAQKQIRDQLSHEAMSKAITAQLMEQQFPLKRGNKYRARKVKIDGITFDSIAEARRYQELVVLQKAGVISGLTPHPKFHLIVNGKKIGAYTADSLYVMNGETIIEDVKSPVTLTEAARLRIKLFEALFDQTVIFVGV